MGRGISVWGALVRSWLWAALLGLSLLFQQRALAQTQPVLSTPADSGVVTSVAPDTVRALRPDEPSPDADPTPAPLSSRSRWTILGACALLTLSTLLLYNVRSR